MARISLHLLATKNIIDANDKFFHFNIEFMKKSVNFVGIINS